MAITKMAVGEQELGQALYDAYSRLDQIQFQIVVLGTAESAIAVGARGASKQPVFMVAAIGLRRYPDGGPGPQG